MYELKKPLIIENNKTVTKTKICINSDLSGI